MSTQLDDVVFRRVRLEALRQGRPMSAIIGDAVRKYLDDSGTPAGAGGVVATTYGALDTPWPEIAAIMHEEDDFLGA